MCGPKFCSMNISQEVRQYAKEQEAAAAAAAALVEIELPELPVVAAEGMRQMSEEFKARGAALYH